MLGSDYHHLQTRPRNGDIQYYCIFVSANVLYRPFKGVGHSKGHSKGSGVFDWVDALPAARAQRRFQAS